MIYYSDFETSTKLVNNKVNVYLWGLISNDNLIREYGVNIKSFFDYLSKEDNAIVYFHNISWDGCFIIHYLLDNNFKFVENIEKKDKYVFSWIADYNTNIYNIKVKFNKNTITFLDSLKILVNSVEKLGKVLNLPKLKIDYQDYTFFNSKEEVPEILKEYLFRDIDIVREYMVKFKSKVSKLKTTIASTMYNEFIEYYGPYNFIKDFGNPFKEGKNVITKEIWLKVKQSYNGGFTAVSPRYLNVDIKNINGVSYDWNSMYPSVMLNYKMPYGTPTNFKLFEDDLELLEIRIINATKKYSELPAMLAVNNTGMYVNKYEDNVKDTTITIWKEEFEILLKLYDIDYLKISTLYFRCKYVFRDFIAKIKEEKINATNLIDRYIAKIKQNSLYGKFGQSIERISKILVFDPDKLICGIRYGQKQEWVEVRKTTYLNIIPYIPIASYITSKARTLLFEAIYKNKDKFIYCDTDSIYLTSEGVGLDISDKEYGCVKIEHRFDRFKCLKLKCYMLNDIKEGIVIRVAGLPDKGQKTLNFDNFEKGMTLIETKLQKKHYVGGLILENIDYTL